MYNVMKCNDQRSSFENLCHRWLKKLLNGRNLKSLAEMINFQLSNISRLYLTIRIGNETRSTYGGKKLPCGYITEIVENNFTTNFVFLFRSSSKTTAKLLSVSLLRYFRYGEFFSFLLARKTFLNWIPHEYFGEFLKGVYYPPAEK